MGEGPEGRDRARVAPLAAGPGAGDVGEERRMRTAGFCFDGLVKVNLFGRIGSPRKTSSSRSDLLFETMHN